MVKHSVHPSMYWLGRSRFLKEGLGQLLFARPVQEGSIMLPRLKAIMLSHHAEHCSEKNSVRQALRPLFAQGYQTI
jgi:hypothetical protein